MKRKFIKPEIFYLLFIIVNLLNAFIITQALFHPSISPYKITFFSLLFSLIGNLGVLVLLLTLGLVIFRSVRRRMNYLVIVTVIFSIFCLFLAVFGNIFSEFFDFEQMDSFNNPSEAAFIGYYISYGATLLMDFTQFVHLIPVVVIILARIFTNAKAEPLIRFSRFQKAAMAGLGALFMAVALMFTFAKVKDTPYKNVMNPLFGSSNAGLYNFYLYDIADYFIKDNEVMTESNRKEIEDYLNEKSQAEHISPLDGKTYTRSNAYTGTASNTNLIAVQLESFTDFVIGLKVNGIEITPNINAIVAKSLSFDRFYSSSGIGNTSEAEFSFATGLYGTGKNLAVFEYFGTGYPTIAKSFNQKGYDTFSLNGDEGEFYRRSTEHLRTLGFQRHYEAKDFPYPYIHGFINDYDLLSQTADMLLSEPGPFFNLTITSTSHAPYVPHELVPVHDFGPVTSLAQNFLDYMMYLDNAIGMFVDKLKPILDQTTIVFYGDHSSSLFQKDLESILGRKLTDGMELRLIMQNVACFFYNESLFTPEVDHTVHGTIDLYQTLANFYGLDYPYTFGVDMLSDEPAFVYCPRNQDIFFDDFILIAPSKRAYDKKLSASDITKYYDLWARQKEINDLILRTKYFAW
jgi:phosphoglycerol transferase MdoB-like AlkP superfamily enzyme